MEGVLVGLKCIVCSSVEDRQKTIVPKNDNLAKHQGKQIYTVDGVPSGMKINDVYSTMNCGHMKATRIWAYKKRASVAE